MRKNMDNLHYICIGVILGVIYIIFTHSYSDHLLNCYITVRFITETMRSTTTQQPALKREGYIYTQSENWPKCKKLG